jgi:thiol-disulfide isomerase/thioredoxin
VSRTRLLVIAVVGAAALMLLVIGLGTKQGATAKRAAPPLPTQVLHAPTVSLASLRGHAVLVNFWASWCHPCQKEAPQLTRFAQQAKGIRLIGVDTGDNAHDAARFISRYGWSFPVLRDADSTTGDRYGLPGLPTTFALDAQGRIVRTLTGPQTAKTLAAAYAAAAA